MIALFGGDGAEGLAVGEGDLEVFEPQAKAAAFGAAVFGGDEEWAEADVLLEGGGAAGALVAAAEEPQAEAHEAFGVVVEREEQLIAVAGGVAALWAVASDRRKTK